MKIPTAEAFARALCDGAATITAEFRAYHYIGSEFPDEDDEDCGYHCRVDDLIITFEGRCLARLPVWCVGRDMPRNDSEFGKMSWSSPSFPGEYDMGCTTVKALIADDYTHFVSIKITSGYNNYNLKVEQVTLVLSLNPDDDMSVSEVVDTIETYLIRTTPYMSQRELVALSDRNGR